VTKQDYQTPREFIAAVERRFGTLTVDLAAHAGNTQCSGYFNAEADSLKQDWTKSELGYVAWLNPPFANIRPWAAKCESVRLLPRWTLLLVPASIGTGWYADHVAGKAMVFGIPRITFVGTDAPYPKDLMLCAFGFGVAGHGFWDWRVDAGTEVAA
jgi:phage N-6-adenine-methyltransferase